MTNSIKKQFLKLAAATAALLGILHASNLPAPPLSLPDHARYVFEKVGENLGLGTITVPKAVKQICTLTWYCQLGNIHANTTGYTVIGNLIDKVVK